ncbi:response regulator transcription factor [Kutzneria viridogrisea]
MARVIDVAVVDNDKLVPAGLRAMLAPVAGIQVVGTSTSVHDHLRAGLSADVVLLDLILEDGRDPSQNVAAIRETGARVLVMSVHGDRHHVRDTIRAGASGYLLKDDDTDKLAEAIRAVHAGELAMTPELAFIITLQPPRLTERQVEVLHLYGTGCTLEATAHRLRISVGSVRTHLSRIYAKFAAAGDPIRSREDIPPRVRDYEIGPS